MFRSSAVPTCPVCGGPKVRYVKDGRYYGCGENPPPLPRHYRETDADFHAEDVWHTRYDGTEDVQR